MLAHGRHTSVRGMRMNILFAWLKISHDKFSTIASNRRESRTIIYDVQYAAIHATD